MITINDRVEAQISEETVTFPMVICASHSESIRIHEVQDVYQLLSAISKVVAIMNTPKEI